MRSVTSSSNIFRRKLCPGSHNLEASVIDAAGDNAPADEGTLLHPFACNRKLSRDHLTDAQRRLLKRADSASDRFLSVVSLAYHANPLTTPATWTEERVTLHGTDGIELFDGASDLVWQFDEGAAVQDFKLGFMDVTPAPMNYQVASYGLMWTDFLKLDRATVAINQPRHSKDELSIAYYDRHALEKARKELTAIMQAAWDPKAPRIAGAPQCDFCTAKLFCDEYKARYRALEQRPEAQTIQTLDTEELHRMGIACKTADRIKGRVMDEIARRIEAGEMPGWHLQETGETRELIDIVGAFKELSAYFERIGGFNGRRFTECTTIVWGRLTKLVQELTGFTEGRSKALISELLNPFIAAKPKRPTPQPIHE